MVESLAPRIAAWLSARMPGWSNLSVPEIHRISGGASRETYRIRVCFEESGTPAERRLILRRDPPTSLIETERGVEFAAIAAFHDTNVPVPRALWLEDETAWLDRPFCVMEEITGCQTDAALLGVSPYVELREHIGRQKWTILGTIAAQDPQALGLTAHLQVPALDRCWRRELDYWEGVLDEDQLEPEPLTRAAIRRLRRRPPPPAQKLGVVHGDYRTGNFLFDPTGAIKGILDWEMCHLGDPVEDLAWAFNPVFAGPDPGYPGRLIARADAIAIWERTSGLRADPEALAWWELFSAVKGNAIWISAAREYAEGRNRDPIQIAAGWFVKDLQDRFLPAQLEAMP